MGNPTILRLGINQIWYKYWYSDTLFKENLHQDNLITTLVSLFFRYGLTYNNNKFLHIFWYKNSITFNKSKYYKKCYYLNNTLSIEHSFLLRRATEEFFPLKLWLLKYIGWVILSIIWFKPFKKKQLSLSKFTDINLNFFKKNKFSKSKRIKIILIFFIKKINILKKEFIF